MSTYDFLMEHRTKEELARELVATVKDNIRLRDAVGVQEVELFWMKVVERDSPYTPALVAE